MPIRSLPRILSLFFLCLLYAACGSSGSTESGGDAKSDVQNVDTSKPDSAKDSVLPDVAPPDLLGTDQGQDSSGKEDTAGDLDSSQEDQSTPDTADTGGDDTGTDTGADTGTNDGGTDSGTNDTQTGDTGIDSGGTNDTQTGDTGTDSGGTNDTQTGDTGTDSGGTTDSSSDGTDSATDGSADDQNTGQDSGDDSSDSDDGFDPVDTSDSTSFDSDDGRDANTPLERTIEQIQLDKFSTDCGDSGTITHPTINQVIVKDVIVTAGLHYADGPKTLYRFYVADPSGGVNSGIAVIASASEYPDSSVIKVGDRVTITGVIEEFFCFSRIKVAAASDVVKFQSGVAPKVLAITCDMLSKPDQGNESDDLAPASDGELYEGVLVSLSDITTVTNLQFGEIVITDKSGNSCLMDNDFGLWTAGNQPGEGTKYDALIGVIRWSFDDYVFQPIDASELLALTAEAGDPQTVSRGTGIKLSGSYTNNALTPTCSWVNETTGETHDGCEWDLTAHITSTFKLTVTENINNQIRTATDTVVVTVQSLCQNKQKDSDESGTDCGGRTVWINELHYDDVDTDADEGFEIAGPSGMALTGWTMRHYDGDGSLVETFNLSGILADAGDGIGLKWFDATNGLSDSKGGLMLLDNEGRVRQFISWGDAALNVEVNTKTLTSTLIGVVEDNNTADGQSLQLTGFGNRANTFSWAAKTATRGTKNDGQFFYEMCQACSGTLSCGEHTDCSSGEYCSSNSFLCTTCSLSTVTLGLHVGDSSNQWQEGDRGDLVFQRTPLDPKYTGGAGLSKRHNKYGAPGYCETTTTTSCKKDEDCPNAEPCVKDAYLAAFNTHTHSLDVLFPFAVTRISFDIRQGLNWSGFESQQYQLIGADGQVVKTGVLDIPGGEKLERVTLADFDAPVVKMVIWGDLTNLSASNSVCWTDANTRCTDDSHCTTGHCSVTTTKECTTDDQCPGETCRLCKKSNYSVGLDNIRYLGPGCSAKQITDFNPTGADNPQNLTVIGDTLYLSALNETGDRWLSTSDGTYTGSVLVKQVDPSNNSSGDDFVQVGNLILFAGNGGDEGTELWATDGTTDGTQLLKDISPGTSGSFPGELAVVNGTLFFDANDGVNGTELWVSDGTENGTSLLKNIRAGASSGSTGVFLAIGNTLVFRASDGIEGTELWKSDGTSDGTTVIKDIRPGASSSFPSNLINFNGTLLFTSSDGTNGTELWKSDLTQQGTELVKDIHPGASSSSPLNFLVIGTTVYFSAFTTADGRELYKSDGTSAGTSMVKDINTNGSSTPSWLTAFKGKLYFRAYDGTNGSELWVSDGTEGGTTRVTDINPDAGSSTPGNIVVYRNYLFFAANDGTNGIELWMSDGSPAGTMMVADINPDGDGNPTNLMVVNDTLFFVANPGSGNKLFSFKLK